MCGKLRSLNRVNLSNLNSKIQFWSTHTCSSLKAASTVNLHWGADNPMTQFLSSNPMEEDTPELLTARLLSQRAHFCRSCPNEKHSIQPQPCELSAVENTPQETEKSAHLQLAC